MKKYFSENTRKAAAEIVQNILFEAEDTLSKSTWMDKKTLANALKKARAITPVIGYPNGLLDSSNMETYFRDLKMDSTNYFQNILWTKKHDTHKRLIRLRETVDKHDWRSLVTPALFNALYYPDTNVICNSIN